MGKNRMLTQASRELAEILTKEFDKEVKYTQARRIIDEFGYQITKKLDDDITENDNHVNTIFDSESYDRSSTVEELREFLNKKDSSDNDDFNWKPVPFSDYTRNNDIPVVYNTKEFPILKDYFTIIKDDGDFEELLSLKPEFTRKDSWNNDYYKREDIITKNDVFICGINFNKHYDIPQMIEMINTTLPTNNMTQLRMSREMNGLYYRYLNKISMKQLVYIDIVGDVLRDFPTLEELDNDDDFFEPDKKLQQIVDGILYNSNGGKIPQIVFINRAYKMPKKYLDQLVSMCRSYNIILIMSTDKPMYHYSEKIYVNDDSREDENYRKCIKQNNLYIDKAQQIYPKTTEY